MPSAKPNELDIAGLRELEKLATAGPWESNELDYPDLQRAAVAIWPKTTVEQDEDPDYLQVCIVERPRTFTEGVTDTQVDADLRFVAALRNVAVSLLALAEIGQAAVEKHQLPDMAESGISADECVTRMILLRNSVCKIGSLIESYLARKDG